tara:strand:- start:353 stop:2695 length:2343 start_codon:yes stop_codon:yes gene_type:complete
MSDNSANLKRKLNEVRKDPAKLSKLRVKLNAAVASLPGLKGRQLTYLLNGNNKSNSVINSQQLLLMMQYLLILLVEDKTPVPEKIEKRNTGPIKIEELAALIETIVGQTQNNALQSEAFAFLKHVRNIGTVNFTTVPPEHQRFANRIYEEITKPKIMVFMNPGGATENRNPQQVVNNTGNGKNIRNLADSDNYINVVKPDMDFRKFKDANKTSVVMSIGSSGAGKTFLLDMLDKSDMYGKRNSVSYYAPSVTIYRKGRADALDVFVDFASATDDISENNFTEKYLKPSPFNPASSRAHKMITYERGDIIVDLCGTESAVDISINALGFNLFEKDIFNLRASGGSVAVMEGLKEMKLDFSDIIVTSTQAESKFNKKTNYAYKVGTLDGLDINTIRLKHAIACGIVKTWATKNKSPRKVVDITSDDIINKLQKEYKNRLKDEKAYQKTVPATYYAFQILSRCLEGLWISRTLDELALIYNAADRVAYFKGNEKRGWSTSAAYSIPSGMTHNGTTYNVKLSNLKATGAKPFALGASQAKTPISTMIPKVEPKFKKNKLNTGESADATTNLHRMVVLLRYTRGLPLENIHKSVLKRISGWAKLKASAAGKAVNENVIKLAVNQLFNDKKSFIRAPGFESMIGTRFMVGRKQAFPNPGTPEFEQMINEIGKKDGSKLSEEQKQVARLRLTVLKELANKNDALMRIRNRFPTTTLGNNQKKKLKNAINAALEKIGKNSAASTLNQINGREQLNENDLLRAIAVVESPGGVLALGRRNSLRKINPRV